MTFLSHPNPVLNSLSHFPIRYQQTVVPVNYARSTLLVYTPVSSPELFYKNVTGIGLLLSCDKYVDCLFHSLFVIPVVGVYCCAMFGLRQLGVRKSSSTQSLMCCT